MKTTLHTYSYDTNDSKTWPKMPGWTAADAARFDATLRGTPGRGHQMHSLKMRGSNEPQPGEIELEPQHLFENQWNSDKGRVFDWYEEAVFSGATGREMNNIKRGHYLDITDEMVAIRRDTLKCAYTGQQFAAADYPEGKPRFNIRHSAIGSPYLKETELHMLRLRPVCDEFKGTLAPLTEAERAFLLPLYITAQSQAQGKARSKQLLAVQNDYDKTVQIATIERDGFTWLLNKGVNLENCIFYDHTRRFGFGWRNPYPEVARLKLLELLKDFPFEYDVK